MKDTIRRRDFLAATAAAGAGLVILRDPASARAYQANEKLNVALVGVAGRGQWFVSTIPRIGENVVAMCDVNQRRAAPAFAKLPAARKFQDFRKMLDEMGAGLDGVVVATPDHIHAPCSVAAMKHGKHVYCEKPLTHDLREARAVRQTAAASNVATQMGNQGTATDAFRRAVELVEDGTIGEVREVHVWNTNGGPGWTETPTGSEPVPDWLAWDLWLGPAASRPFHSDWLNWHGWREFGTGQLGNWAVHTANLPFMALKLGSLWSADGAAEPARTIRVTAEVSALNGVSFPRWELIHWEVPARGELPPVTVHWYNGAGGQGLPRARLEELMGRRLDWGDAGAKKWDDFAGCLLVGSKGMLHSTGHNSTFSLLPESKFSGYQGPPQRLPRSGSHEREWLRACRGGPPAMSNFGHGSLLVEFVLLGNVATQFDQQLEFDPVEQKILNSAEADRALGRQYREGWSL